MGDAVGVSPERSSCGDQLGVCDGRLLAGEALAPSSATTVSAAGHVLPTDLGVLRRILEPEPATC